MKTEVKNVEKSQLVGQELLKYFNNTSKHLFITDDNRFYKVLPIKVENNWYVCKIYFDGELCQTSIYKLNDLSYEVKRLMNKGMYTSAAKVAVHEWKMDLFPKSIYDGYGYKRTSIKNFKLMKEKMFEVIKCVQKNLIENGEQHTKEEIMKILKDIKPSV
jgi:hypothetical protein